MAIRPATAEIPTSDSTWRAPAEVLPATANLARTEESPGRFYPALLERIISALAADGGAIWTRDAEGSLDQKCLVNPPERWNRQDVVEVAAHQRLVDTVLTAGEPQLIPPNRKPSPGEKLANPTDALLILFPWHVDRAPAGVIEIFQRPGGGPSAERGYLEFLDVVSDFVAEFDRNCQLRQLKQSA